MRFLTVIDSSGEIHTLDVLDDEEVVDFEETCRVHQKGTQTACFPYHRGWWIVDDG